MKKHIILFTLLLAFCASTLSAKRIKTKINVTATDTVEIVNDSFVISTDACETCNSGYDLSQIVFSGFDKNISSNSESFFITNNTDCLLETVTIEIEYLTIDAKMLHKRIEQISLPIPAGETRRIDIRTWDKQKSFYYYLSSKPKRKATPFKVRITPTSARLRFQ